MKRNLLKAILTEGPGLIACYFKWMRKYTKHPEKYDIKDKYASLHKLVKNVNHGLDIDIHVVGRNNVPDVASCLICNHIDAVDPITILGALDIPTTFVCKKELAKVPFVNKCVRSIEGEFIDRQDLKESLRTMMKVEADLKKGNKNWLIFPEGTRNKDDRALLLDFHHGTFRPAFKAQVPIVPICIYGSHRVLSKKFKFKRYPVYLEFGKPLTYEEYKDLKTQEIAELVQSRIQTMLSYHARKIDRDNLIELLGDKYKENY